MIKNETKMNKFKLEIINLLFDYNKYGSLPSRICSNPMNAMSIRPEFYVNNHELNILESLWVRFKNNKISAENFTGALEEILNQPPLTQEIMFLILLIHSKNIKKDKQYLLFLEEIYITDAPERNYYEFSYIIRENLIRPACLALITEYFGVNKSRKIKNRRDKIMVRN